MKIIHNYRDPYFGGFSPECNEKNLGELRKVVADEKFDLGLATDGDADRFGIIDDRNRFVSPNTILALLALYLKRYRNIPGGLARSVATTHLIDAIARKLDVPLYETPVGFKYIGELILDGQDRHRRRRESAGMSMYRHLPEKDGILACLLVAEMVARTGKKLKRADRRDVRGVRPLLLEAHRHEADAAAEGLAGGEAGESAAELEDLVVRRRWRRRAPTGSWPDRRPAHSSGEDHPLPVR